MLFKDNLTGTDLAEVKFAHQKLHDELHIKLGKRDTLKQKLENGKQRLQHIEKEIEWITKGVGFLQTLSDLTRQQILDRIGNIVTDALQRVKDPNLTFRMNLTMERNQVDLKFTIYDAVTKMEYDILKSRGGTLAHIVGFPLRISLLVKWNPSLSRILILDEDFYALHEDDQEPMAEFIRQISEKLNVQIISVSHDPTIAKRAHRIFQVLKRNGKSTVEEKPS